MKLTTSLLDDLSARAKASPRLRMNLDLRNSAEDGSQAVKSNFFFSTFKKFSFQLISAVCIQHKVGHFCYSL